MIKDRKYELLIIFSLKDSKDVSAFKNRVKEILNETGFSIYQDYEMGERNLAYPIRKEKVGYYWIPKIIANENGKINELLILLKREKFVLRALIFKYDEEKIKRLKAKEEEFKKKKLELQQRKASRVSDTSKEADKQSKQESVKEESSENTKIATEPSDNSSVEN